MTSFTLHLGRFSGCRQIWAFLFGALASQAMSPLFSEQCLACSDILQLGLGAHGWVSRICQPWEQSPSRSWLPIVKAPGWFRHPTFSFSDAVVNFSIETTTKEKTVNNIVKIYANLDYIPKHTCITILQ